MLLQIAVLVGSYLLSTARAPKPKAPKAPAFEDIDFPLCKESEEKTAVFGQKWTKSWMVLTVGNYRTKTVRGKGGKK